MSHSLCTLEFEGRQAVDGPYYWLLDVLKLYKPTTWEYSRLNITHCVMSKRKLKHLVLHGHVDGWDDPRLVSLSLTPTPTLTPTLTLTPTSTPTPTLTLTR